MDSSPTRDQRQSSRSDGQLGRAGSATAETRDAGGDGHGICVSGVAAGVVFHGRDGPLERRVGDAGLKGMGVLRRVCRSGRSDGVGRVSIEGC